MLAGQHGAPTQRLHVVFGADQGILLSSNRDLNSGTLGTLPQLLRNPGAAAPPTFPSAPTYPIAATVSNSVNAFDPNLQTPYAQTWTAGIQRKLTRNTALEFRWVGSQHLQGLTTYNYNEYNIVAAFAVASILTLLALGTLGAKQALDMRRRAAR